MLVYLQLGANPSKRQPPYLIVVVGEAGKSGRPAPPDIRIFGGRIELNPMVRDQGQVGDGNHARGRIPLRFSEGIELLQITVPGSGPFVDLPLGRLVERLLTSTSPPGKAHLPANG